MVDYVMKFDFHLITKGGTKEVWTPCKLAARVHHGRHTDAAEEGDGSPAQPEVGPASGRYLFLALKVVIYISWTAHCVANMQYIVCNAVTKPV